MAWQLPCVVTVATEVAVAVPVDGEGDTLAAVTVVEEGGRGGAGEGGGGSGEGGEGDVEDARQLARAADWAVALARLPEAFAAAGVCGWKREERREGSDQRVRVFAGTCAGSVSKTPPQLQLQAVDQESAQHNQPT